MSRSALNGDDLEAGLQAVQTCKTHVFINHTTHPVLVSPRSRALVKGDTRSNTALCLFLDPFLFARYEEYRIEFLTTAFHGGLLFRLNSLYTSPKSAIVFKQYVSFPWWCTLQPFCPSLRLLRAFYVSISRKAQDKVETYTSSRSDVLLQRG